MRTGHGNPAFLRQTRLALPLFAWLALAAGAVLAADNPHWQGDGCTACHAVAEPSVADPALKAPDASALCAQCHKGRRATVCRHRSEIAVDAARAAEMAPLYRDALNGDRVVCTTCHDLSHHSEVRSDERYRNPSFVRGAPEHGMSRQCFGCHERRDYRSASPHRQVRRGEIQQSRCEFCHGAASAGPSIDPARFCTSCHAVAPHPSGITGGQGWIHLAEPSSEMLERMRDTVLERGGKLPLDHATGRITCATCHNPHDRNLVGDPRSDERTRAKLRYDNICGVCHAF